MGDLKMKIAVLGATGQTGQQLVKQALQQGHIITAIVRNRLNVCFFKTSYFNALMYAMCALPSISFVRKKYYCCHNAACNPHKSDLIFE